MDSSIARERLSSVVKPDSITTTQGDFLATHVAIKKLHLLNKFALSPTEGDSFTEEEIFRNYVLNPENKHQLIAVYGQSGTGKSHLIRWFDARFEQEKPENEVVLFIRRSDNTLKGTIRQLLSKPEVQNIANKDVYERLSRASVTVDENKLKDMIYHNFIIELHNDDDSHEYQITSVKRKRLEAFLNNEVVHEHLLDADGPIERIYSKIAENTLVDRDTVAQFRAEDFFVSPDLFDDIQRAGADPKAEKMARVLMADDGSSEEAAKFANYLNQFVNDVVQRCAGIEPGDFRQIFQDIRKELFRLGKNLTLFIEDVTSFTGVDDALLDALIIENTGMNEGDNLCRISSIVGTTGNYLQNNFRDNHKERITQYVYIPDNAFDEAEIFEFIGRYLNTMSLPVDTINDWVLDHASPESYPIHEVKEGGSWEFISIEFDKKLCLYPFTKNSIRYFYQYRLTAGHRTPRYIIRDIIEPIVTDALNHPDTFPAAKYDIVNVNTALSFKIHNQIQDETSAERLLTFLSIWGDNSSNSRIEGSHTYISGVDKAILLDLKLPVLKLDQTSSTRASNPPPDPVNVHPTDVPPTPPTVILPKNSERINKANKILSQWIAGQPIDVSTNVGVAGILNAAQNDICNYLFSSISWQAFGISMDNISKVKHSTKTLVMFENQTKGSGLYVMPADWNSMNIISAFIRWREYGKQSWNYPDSDFDAYLISSWVEGIKDELIKLLSPIAEDKKTSYIDAAVSAEIYRLILSGVLQGTTLKGVTIESILTQYSPNAKSSCHSKSWISLLELLSQKQADKINKDTIRGYFNIVQGDGGSFIVLNDSECTNVLKKVKKNHLQVPKTDMEVNDPFKLRRDVFAYLRMIEGRIDTVVRSELAAAREQLSLIQQHLDLDEDEFDEDEILELVDQAKEFYHTANETLIHIKVPSMDKVKKAPKKIAQAIETILNIQDEDDTLSILMAFASDPISDLMPLVELLSTLDQDIQKTEQQIMKRKEAVSDILGANQPKMRYSTQLEWAESDAIALTALR